MLRQIVLGGSVCLVNFAIHAVLVAVVVVAAHRAVGATMALRAGPAPDRCHRRRRGGAAVRSRGRGRGLGAVLWARRGCAWADPFYFAFVNYTTLGYGDVVPSAEWRLIGPITAMNGVLLFGWSTAVLFDVIGTVGETLRRRPD